MGTEDIEFGTCIVGGLGKYCPAFCGSNDYEDNAYILMEIHELVSKHLPYFRLYRCPHSVFSVQLNTSDASSLAVYLSPFVNEFLIEKLLAFEHVLELSFYHLDNVQHLNV